LKNNWKTNGLILSLLGIILYMINISWSQDNIQGQGQKDTFDQQAYLDSMRAWREYRSSQQYKDSMSNVRQARRDSMIAARQQIQDSMRYERERVQDSMKAIREAIIAENRRVLDSTKSARMEEQAIRKAALEKRKDSLNALKAYRNSKAYKDSVAFVRQNRKDSIIAARKHVQDSMRQIQIEYRDSLIAEREKAAEELRASIDSMRKERLRMMDSLAEIREARRDSIAKLREEREAARKLREEEKEEERKLKLQLKIEQEQEAYTNEDMRKKPWRFPRSIFQNVFTRYNYWYNTNEKLKEVENNIIRNHEDDPNSLIPLFVINPEIYGSQLKTEMDSLIQRASIGIQIHDPRSKWQDDLYLIIGKSYYYKGDYENAMAAFRYAITIGEEIKEKYEKKHPKWDFDKTQFSMPERKGKHLPARNDAIIWLARAMRANEESNKAMSLLLMVNNESQFPERLRGKLNLELANIYLELGQFDRALEPLNIAVNDKHLDNDDLYRARFVLGQLYQNQGNLEKANEQFAKIKKGNIPLELDFYAKNKRYWNTYILGENTKKAQESLAKLAKEEKYINFSGNAYLTLAKTYAIEENYDLAIKNLENSIKNATHPLIESEAQTLLADYYYLSFDYAHALENYTLAIEKLNEEKQQELYLRAMQRSQALNELVPFYNDLKAEDSLARLMELNEQEQREEISNYIKNARKEQKDSIRLAEQNALNDPALALNQRNRNRNSNTGNSYFDNPQMLQKGLQEFKRVWGNRPLQDNWRRLTQDNSFNNQENFEEELVIIEDEDGIPTEEYLFSQIPKSEQEKEKTYKNIEGYLFLVAKAYYTHVEDYELAAKSFKRYINEFPGGGKIADAYYYLYLIQNNKENLGDKEETFRIMKDKFGEDHVLVKQIHNSQNKINNNSSENNEEHEFIYEQLYQLSVENQYPKLLDEIKYYKEELALNFKEYEANIALLEIIGEVGVNNKEDALLNLELFFINYPAKKDLIKIAEKIQEMLTNEEEWTESDFINPINDSYIYDKNDIYDIIILVDDVPESMSLKGGISDYNLMSAHYGEHPVQMQSFTANKNIIIIKNFENLTKSKKYLQDLLMKKILFKDIPSKELIFRPISPGNLQKLLYTKDWEEYEIFYKNNLK